MLHVYVFNLIQAAICIFAFVSGGWPERLTASVLLLASFATVALPFDPARSFHNVEVAEMAIDVALLAGLSAIALWANRFWPLWLAALQLLGVAVHGVKAFDPMLVPWMYAGAAGKLGYPMLFILLAGVWRHHARVERFGCDPDWSPTA